MLTSISIENFRCFEKAEFDGFSLINILGGQNNAGKTALLEAIYLLYGQPTHTHLLNAENDPIHDLFKFRKFDVKIFSPYLKERIYETLFWNQDPIKEIFIRSTGDDSIGINIEYKKGIDTLIINGNFLNYELSPNQCELKFKNHSYLDLPPILFLPTQYEKSKIDIVREYEALEYRRKESIMLKAFQIIEPSITNIKTYSSDPLSIHLAREGESYLPISFYGDAMNKIAACILHLVKVPKGILLIDEIENGIHHEHQRDFWRALLLLAKEYEVQIFATSHSLEMIRAYNDVAMELAKENPEFAEDCHYFEMVRHAKTQQITAIKMGMDMLHRKIVKNNPFRGE